MLLDCEYLLGTTHKDNLSVLNLYFAYCIVFSLADVCGGIVGGRVRFFTIKKCMST